MRNCVVRKDVEGVRPGCVRGVAGGGRNVEGVWPGCGKDVAGM